MLSCTYMYQLKKHKDRLAIVLQQNQKIFHTQDLAVLWGLPRGNTLYTTIKRYTHRGILQQIFKGLYSTVPLNQLDPVTIGRKALHGFNYLSCETVLQKYGLVNFLVEEITFVSSLSKKFSIGRHHFRSRKLHDRFLFNCAGVFDKEGTLEASKERAVADMLYFNPKFHFDAPVNWSAVKKVQENLHYPLTPHRYVDPQTKRRSA